MSRHLSGLVSRPGTIVKLADGRIGTTVYNGLDGVGIKWGRHDPQTKDFEGTSGNCVEVAQDSPARAHDWAWMPDAMLRDPYPGAELECVGQDYELLADDEEETEVREPVEP